MSKRASNLLHRRDLLAVLGAGFGAALAGCGASSTSPTAATTSGTTTPTTGGTSSSCAVVPSETEGPYPDTTGMINKPAFFRRDITEGKAGLPLTLTLTVVNVSSGCSPVSGANSKGQNSTANAGDMVFSDGTTNELASLTGNTTSGYTATLTLGI